MTIPLCNECGSKLEGYDQIFDCDCCGGTWCVICWCEKDIGGNGEQEGFCAICESDTEIQ